ncbi:surface lipoprotein assembly modifier [Kingella negevensis]|uniref:surface lipoprotein assembly modifier n=1 Tax=Kingella negevensis TaxID=1522312 RepID=UPI000A26D272|nr:surface lipoprotein assembly modifier [Kingella negevensis]WII91682.1 surface lipoprotein assembly modifier [Kingella negevensis]
MKKTSLLFLTLTATAVQAAPVSTPLNQIPDLNQEQISQQTETVVQPENAKQHSASMTADDLLKQPELLQNALDTAINQQNVNNIRFLLSIYRKQPENQQDAVLLKYAESFVQRADGKQDEAEQNLRELVQAHPEFAPIRLQYALTLLQNGEQKEAAQEVAKIRETLELPEDVSQYLNQFDAHLKNEKAWQFNANAYYLNEGNVGRAPEQRTYGNWQFPEPKKAHGFGYELSAQKTVPIKGHWAARVNASVYGKFYWDAHDYDDLVAHTEAGAVWRNAKQEVSLMPFYEKRWYGTEPYSQTSGAILRYSRTLSPSWQVYGAWQSDYKRHDDRLHLNGADHSASVSVLYRSSPQQYFVIGAGAGRSNAKDLSDAYVYSNARVSWTRNWRSLKNLSTTLSVSAQRRNYRAPDFFNIRRHDKEYFTRLSVSHPKLSWGGFVPRLNWTWSHVNSDHFYYRYNQNRVFVDVMKQF